MEQENYEMRKERLLELLNDRDYSPMKINEIAFFMDVPKKDSEMFQAIVDDLIREGAAVVTRRGKIMSPKKLNLICGTFLATIKGFGFVSSEQLERDAFVAAENTKGAMHKDKVLIRIISEGEGGRRKEAEVVEVLERGMNIIVGTFEKRQKGGVVIADDKKLCNEIFIPESDCKGAVTGHKVTVKIKSVAPDNIRGEITSILGHKNDPGVDILSIVAQYEIPTEFPDEVYEQTEKISDEVSEADIADRTDLRNVVMVTIDGEDAKDLDDAVSLEMSDNGNYRLGVHIADVSHYVRQNTPLYKEAYNRGTSVYLVDRVIPMLPHKLSNGICSLNPQVDRLALSCIMEIDKDGAVLSADICQSVINTNRRMTYEAVNEILTDESSPLREEYAELVPMFEMMSVLRSVLRENRIKRGAIEFDFAECKIILDEKGVPTEIRPYYRNIATSIIEEFMLICNETVAERYHWLELPFVYRTHEEPDNEKMLYLSKFVRRFGHNIKGSKAFTKSIQGLLHEVENTPEEPIINKVVLRSMKQARYTPNNIGHFGLAAKYYCHFTSPIRRFPDLQIHQIIKDNINGKLDTDKIDALNNALPEICRRCCVTERTAEEAEREADNLKKVQFMEDKIGQEFTGVISGVTNWGIYVELPNTVEGMVSVNDLTGDYFVFEEEHMQLRGERSGKTYRLGDTVKIAVARANTEIRKIDFVIAE